MNASALPQLDGRVHEHGYDGRYRVWTAAHGVAFDSLPPYDRGGPAVTTLDGWNVSTSTSTRQRYDGGGVEELNGGQHTLSVWRGDPFASERHPDLDGRLFPTRRDADRAAYDAGVVGLFVSEPHTFRYGLPTVITRDMDLAPLRGVRVRIDRDVPGQGRHTHYGTFYRLRHSEWLGEAGGMFHEEPHGSCPGGDTAFTLPYDTTIITRA